MLIGTFHLDLDAIALEEAFDEVPEMMIEALRHLCHHLSPTVSQVGYGLLLLDLLLVVHDGHLLPRGRVMPYIIREDGWLVIWEDDPPTEWMAVDMDVLRDVPPLTN